MRWCGHLERRDEDYIGKQIEKLEVIGRQKRGRLKMK
jgi:hypothetical protein